MHRVLRSVWLIAALGATAWHAAAAAPQQTAPDPTQAQGEPGKAAERGTQDPARPPRFVSSTRDWSAQLPQSWRQLTPDESRTVRKSTTQPLPPELTAPRQAEYYPFGNIDSWLTSGFDGRYLVVTRVDGEPPEGEDGLARVREPWNDESWKLEVLDAAWTTIGPEADHPAIRRTTRLVHTGGHPSFRSVEMFVPTGGKTLILVLRAFNAEFEAARPGFDATVASLTFARPARGTQKLSDRLLYPAVIGVLIGVLLLGLRRKPRG